MIFTGIFGNHSRKKWFSVAVLIAVLCGIFPIGVWARTQTDTTNKPWSQTQLKYYTVKFTKHDATCYNNGQIGFIIVNKNTGQNISQADFNSMNITDLSIGYQGTSIDTTMRWERNIVYNFSDTTWVDIASGNYKITLELFLASDFVEVDTIMPMISVVQYYQDPIVRALEKTSRDGISLGNIPTLSCPMLNTGRIQVRVDGGRFPYNFYVLDHDGNHDTLRQAIYWADSVVVIDYDDNHHPTAPKKYLRDNSNTTNDSLASYYRYFTFDSLPAGTFDFYFEDGCGTGFNRPATIQSIGTVDPPELQNVVIYASTGKTTDSNIVKIKPLFSLYEYPYYFRQYAPHMKYRFNDGTGNMQYKYLFPNGLPSSYDGSASPDIILRDTFYNNNSYCQIWEVEDHLQIILEESGLCGEPSEKVFSIHNTNEEYYDTSCVWVTDSVQATSECSVITIRHKDDFSIHYRSYYPNYTSVGEEHIAWRYHFTYPIVWEYREKWNNTLLKRDTITGAIGDRIDRKSVLTKEELQEKLFPLNSNYVDVVYALTDAKGCPLFAGERTIDLKPDTLPSSAPKWTISAKAETCRDKARYITIKEINSVPDAEYNGMTIVMTSAPEGNRFKFKATYSDDLGRWVDSVYTFPGGSTVTNLDGEMGIKVTGAFSPGTYQFEITGAPCQSNRIRLSVTMPEREYTVIETGTAHHQLTSDCIQEFISYPQARIAKVIEHPEPNVENDTIYRTTCFRMVNGPLGGYDPLSTDTLYVKGWVNHAGTLVYHEGDSVRLSVPTDPDHPYVFQIYPLYQNDLCTPYYFYDTVWYDGGALSFDFAMGLMCDANSNTGSVYVKAKHGTPPYTYTLYSKPNQGGVVLFHGTSGTSALPSDTLELTVPMYIDTMLSCHVEDDCHNYFTVNFHPQSLAELQKTWFDNGAKVLSTCEGTYVNMHALQAGALFHYDWYQVRPNHPNGDTLIAHTSDPFFLLTRGSDTAIYRVEMNVPGCESITYKDSIKVNPIRAPYLHIAPDAEVCPGEEVTLQFTPTSLYDTIINNQIVPTPVSFSVVIEDALHKDTVDYYRIESGATMDTTITPILKTVVYPIRINDGQCDYKVSDTIVTVQISNNIMSPCHILTQDDTVCVGGTAHLGAGVDATQNSFPYTLRWYKDYSLTEPEGGEQELYSHELSELELPLLETKTIMYVTVDHEDFCPANNLTADTVLKLSGQDTTIMTCTSSFLLTDDGGIDKNHSVDVTGNVFYTHLFVNDDHIPVTLHFDTLAIGEGSTLMIFSGGQMKEDSMMYMFTGNSDNIPMNTPELIVSRCDSMLVYFQPGPETEIGWTAYVRPSPGIAVATVNRPKSKTVTSRICQSQSKPFEDHNFLNYGIVDSATVIEAMKASGTYFWNETTESKETGCDSVTSMKLIVYPPQRKDTIAVTTSLTGVQWMDSLYKTPGVYVKNTPVDGCDYLNVLKLVVIDIDIPEKDVCYGKDNVVIGISVKAYDSVLNVNSFLKDDTGIGDILAAHTENGMTSVRPYRLDKFLSMAESYKDAGIEIADMPLKPYGVVVYVDPDSNNHGKAISLVDANKHNQNQTWWATANLEKINAKTVVGNGKIGPARMDFAGDSNTVQIKKTAESLDNGHGNFDEWAPAAARCYYYSPTSPVFQGDPSGWYLPACGELILCYAYRDVINQSLKALEEFGFTADVMLGGTNEGPDDMYWSSTESYNKENKRKAAAGINAKGQVVLHINKDSSDNTGRKYQFKVRAMLEFR